MTDLHGKRIAFLLTDGFEDSELTSPWTAVTDAGAEAVLVSPGDGSVTGKNGHEQGVDLAASAAASHDFHALVLPGGVVNADHLRMDSASVDFARAFFAEHKPVAVICHGGWILADADVLHGRTLTSYPSLQTDLRNAGATWVDEEVHVDAGLVSSRTPTTYPPSTRSSSRRWRRARTPVRRSERTCAGPGDLPGPAVRTRQYPARVKTTEFTPQTSAPIPDEQWHRLLTYGVPEHVDAGDILFRSGDREYDLILVESGEVEVVRDSLWWMQETVLARTESHGFIGELGLLNGQGAFLTARVTAPGRIHRVSRAGLRRLMSEDDELCDLLLRELWSRREGLRKGPAALTLKFVGRESDREFAALQRFADRLDLVHTAHEIQPDEEYHLTDKNVSEDDLPVAFIQGEPILRATPGMVADRLGLSYQGAADEVVDLVVVGGGPAGLAAAIYGASEGLSTVLLDAVAPGGQAASTSRIENFLGFPFGVSGGDLIGQASLQALKFGVRVYAPCEAARLAQVGDGLEVALTDGRVIHARTAVVTSGAAYRRLPLARWNDFEGAGIYYAATQLELRHVQQAPVVVVGGANSAGQAALYLAANGCSVRLVARGGDLGARMSSYLVDRLQEDARVEVLTGANVTGLEGEKMLERVRIDIAGDVDARGLFCFIGAEPATSWLDHLERDTDGFLRTGTDVTMGALDSAWARLGREPLPFETSVPRVFAAGDVRRGSMKRVAAAVGEGSSAVASVHRALAG